MNLPISNPIFDLSKIVGWSDITFKQLIKRAFTSYFLGLSKIKISKGTSELADNWMYYENALFHQGRIAVVVKGGKLYMINSAEITEINGGKTATGMPFEVNGYLQFHTMKAMIPGKDGKLHEEYFEENNFAVCLNSMEQIPTLTGIDFFLDKLSQILEAVAYDMEMSKKNLIFLVPERPADKDWGDMLMSWKQGIFAFVAFEKSARPRVEAGVEGAPSERKSGFDMSQVDFHIYQPQGKEREQLWNDWQKIWDIMLFTYGVCFDVLMNKEERASVSEVKAAVDYFVCREQERAQLREQFIRKVGSMLRAEYKLEYGRLGKL